MKNETLLFHLILVMVLKTDPFDITEHVRTFIALTKRFMITFEAMINKLEKHTFQIFTSCIWTGDIRVCCNSFFVLFVLNFRLEIGVRVIYCKFPYT
jgi:hypothetical protein